MTSGDNQPPVADSGPAPPPRKRRRRTAASGATDDCFSCRKRSVACDRKRPYCTQCIDIGKECSGYKTTLTWGVGVASRGKLRGLSCPVAGIDANAAEEIRRRKSSVGKPVKQEEQSDSMFANATFQSIHFTGPASLPLNIHGPGFQPSLPTIQARQEGWQIHGFQPPTRAGPSPLQHRNLQHIQTCLNPQYDGPGAPQSASSTGSLPDEFLPQFDFPQTPGSVNFTEPFPPARSMSYTSQPLSSSIDSLNSTSMDSYDTMSSSIDSMRSRGSFQDHGHYHDSAISELDPFSHGMGHDDMLFSPSIDVQFNYNPFDQLEVQEEEPEPKSFNIFDTRFSSPFFNMTPRLQSLMEYYDRHICTYLVAFDGPENPYRKHILQLAVHNEGLQNAIAALATNNIRMRKEPPPRRIGFVEELTNAFDGSGRSTMSEATPEETCYKQMSIDQLNTQLTDARAAQDDSVLATLLILCLFHVCDSGFSKFKTQLAGVQKLLSLRNPHAQSEFTGWVEMFFIWFDVMTSAVNDREMQIKGETLDMLDYSANLGALEQFSGCDGRLFKLIARLGRLNLLSQGRPVKPQDGMQRPCTSNPHQNSPTRKRKSFSIGRDYSKMDGNGWGSSIYSDDDTDGSGEDEFKYHGVDERREFWTEWSDIRARLQAWQMDTTSAATAAPPSSSPSYEVGQRDLLHINESFRFSALLYTERLGQPMLPSSHPNFQKYVSKALFHITALEITSCVNKFLLWPLFITGTECVSEGHRNIIRTRCIEVQKESGFFNNISSLEVLEKVWREIGNNGPGAEADEIRARRRDSETGRTGKYGQAFRWRKAMDRVDGEYIII